MKKAGLGGSGERVWAPIRPGLVLHPAPRRREMSAPTLLLRFCSSEFSQRNTLVTGQGMGDGFATVLRAGGPGPGWNGVPAPGSEQEGVKGLPGASFRRALTPAPQDSITPKAPPPNTITSEGVRIQHMDLGWMYSNQVRFLPVLYSLGLLSMALTLKAAS